jgi:hypothetical protein
MHNIFSIHNFFIENQTESERNRAETGGAKQPIEPNHNGTALRTQHRGKATRCVYMRVYGRVVIRVIESHVEDETEVSTRN